MDEPSNHLCHREVNSQQLHEGKDKGEYGHYFDYRIAFIRSRGIRKKILKKKFCINFSKGFLLQNTFKIRYDSFF